MIIKIAVDIRSNAGCVGLIVDSPVLSPQPILLRPKTIQGCLLFYFRNGFRIFRAYVSVGEFVTIWID